MHQLIDKKIKITIYLLLLIILSTTSNKSIQTKNNHRISSDKFVVLGLSNNDNLQIAKKLNNLSINNIFFIKKENINKIMSEYNVIEQYNVKKIYPKQVNVIIEPTKFVARIKKDDQFLIGANGKLINNKHTDLQLPILFGKFNSDKFLEFKKVIKDSEFEFMNFRSIFFYSSNRWDIQMIDDTLIRLPEKNLSQALRIAHKIISDDNFKKNRVIDLRISNHIITHK